MTQDIRLKQRFSNFKKALKRLSDAVELSVQRELSDLEKRGLIKVFEFTHELAWKVLKDYFAHQGSTNITGSRDASREGFEKGLIREGHVWMDMIDSRNQSSHSYNEETTDEIVTKIISSYHSVFVELEVMMKSKL